MASGSGQTVRCAYRNRNNPNNFNRNIGFRVVVAHDFLTARTARREVGFRAACPSAPRLEKRRGPFLARCREIGIRRLVLRQLYGDPRRWDILSDLTPVGTYRDNPVYDYGGMEVTYWNFYRTTSASLNLFSDGSISTEYLLARANPGRGEPPYRSFESPTVTKL